MELFRTKEIVVGKAAKRERKELAREVLRYLNERTGRSFRLTTEAHLRPIAARLDEGYKMSDFAKVIDHKVHEWGDDPKMRGYLRPQTLFAPSKFDGYLQAAREAPPPRDLWAEIERERRERS